MHRRALASRRPEELDGVTSLPKLAVERERAIHGQQLRCSDGRRHARGRRGRRRARSDGRGRRGGRAAPAAGTGYLCCCCRRVGLTVGWRGGGRHRIDWLGQPADGVQHRAANMVEHSAEAGSVRLHGRQEWQAREVRTHARTHTHTHTQWGETAAQRQQRKHRRGAISGPSRESARAQRRAQPIARVCGAPPRRWKRRPRRNLQWPRPSLPRSTRWRRCHWRQPLPGIAGVAHCLASAWRGAVRQCALGHTCKLPRPHPEAASRHAAQSAASYELPAAGAWPQPRLVAGGSAAWAGLTAALPAWLSAHRALVPAGSPHLAAAATSAPSSTPWQAA